MKIVQLRFVYPLAMFTMAFLCWPAIGLAHGGGTPRLTDEVAGPYRIYAWTQPEPLRVGEIHVTIGVTPAEDQAGVTTNGDLVQPVTDATVTLHFLSVTDETSLTKVATVGGVGAVYYEADASLQTTGAWRFMIEVEGDAGRGQAEFIEELLPAHTVNWTLLISGAGLFVLLIAFIGVWNRRRLNNEKLTCLK